VDAPTIVHTNNNKIDKINNNNNDIMFIAIILPANNPNPLVLPDTLDNNNANKNYDKLSDNDKLIDNNLSQGGHTIDQRSESLSLNIE
jgi:hypothetical protein